MIEYNYEITRKIGKEIEVFRPDKIPNQLPNKISISGPNSIGKSTLLHIFALGFYGIDNQKIHPSLRKKMKNLLNSDYQEVTFLIKIKSADDTLILVSEKPDPKKHEFIVYENINGKIHTLSSEEFQNKYNVIYDIPENPTDRLNEFTREIADMQRIYGGRLQILEIFIKNIISEIGNKDPNRTIRLEEQLKTLRNDNIILSREIKLSEDNLKLLEYATYHKFQENYGHLESITSERLNRLERKMKSNVRKVKKIDKNFHNSREYVQNKLDDLKSKFDNTTYLLRILIPKTERHNLEMWEKIDFDKIRADLRIGDEFRNLIIKFMTTLNDMQDRNKISIKEIELCEDLVKLLGQYRNLNISVPGTGLSVDELMKLLDQTLTKGDNLRKNKNIIKECMEKLDELKNESESLEKIYFPKIKEMEDNIINSEDFNDSMESIYDEVNKLREDLKFYEEKNKTYSANISMSNFRPDGNCKIGEGKLAKYTKFSEEELLKEIARSREYILDKKAENNYNNGIMTHLEDDIRSLKNQKPHRYEIFLDKLNILLMAVTSLEKKLRVEFVKYLQRISEKTYVKEEDMAGCSTEQLNYYDALFSYLGNRVDTIHHIDKEYKIEKIDLINNCFTTKDGEIVNLLDMGTGQGQLAYLQGLLNSQDNRKIIALIDEVAMMDSTTLGFIHEKLRELYNKNHLLIGIVVQKGDEVKISEI